MFTRFDLISLVLGGALLNGVVDALGPPGLHGPSIARLMDYQRWHGGLNEGITNLPPPAAEPDVTADETIKTRWVELPLDHFADCSDTFKNRYWVQDQWYQRGGPVFVLDAGEENAAYELTSLKNGFFAKFLQEFGGMGVLWEHRYYGKSIPKQKEDRTWLTIEQALADIPTMSVNFTHPKWPNVDLTPASTPWIFVGGSYPGMRAAMSREKYPNIFHAAWAASAPVQARSDMSVYYQPILVGMKARGFGSCVADIQAGMKRIDELLDKESTAADLKNRFFKNGADLTNEQFAFSLASIHFGWQGGLEAGGIDDYCASIQKVPGSDATPPPEGWAPTKGADWIVTRMSKTKYYTPYKLLAKQTYDGRSWMWQYCTQIGFLQCYGPELHHLISKYNSIGFQEQRCREEFPELDHWPQSKAVNREYGGWRMRPSNTFWTGGDLDPWRTLEPLSGLPGAPPVTLTEHIPACGVETPQGRIFGQVLTNSSHMWEFFNSKDGKAAQGLFTRAVHTWIPCFEKKSMNEICPHIPPKCSNHK